MGENQEFYKIDLYSSNPAPKDCNEPGVGWNTRNSDMLKWLNSEDDPQVSWLVFNVVRRKLNIKIISQQFKVELETFQHLLEKDTKGLPPL